MTVPPTTVAGYGVTGPRTPRGARSFVQRGTMRGRPWLCFLEKIDFPGEYWVTAHKTKRDALKR